MKLLYRHKFHGRILVDEHGNRITALRHHRETENAKKIAELEPLVGKIVAGSDADMFSPTYFIGLAKRIMKTKSGPVLEIVTRAGNVVTPCWATYLREFDYEQWDGIRAQYPENKYLD